MPQDISSRPQSNPRTAAELNSIVEKKLLSYATLASATGVGILALVQPLEAKVVYTATHQTIAPNSTLELDLNGDGINDFRFQNRFSGPGFSGTGIRKTFSTQTGAALIAYPADNSNHIWGNSQFGVSVLPAGVMVGSKGKFVGNHSVMGGASEIDGGSPRYDGPWAPPGGNEKNRYVGLKFVINGQVHFGWARLSVQIRPARNGGAQAVLTGYAYETVANKPLETGKTSGADAASAQTATLGQLALGAEGQIAIRREKDAVN
jgi:hypothetical protein